MGVNDVNVKGHHNMVIKGVPYYRHPVTGHLRVMGGVADQRDANPRPPNSRAHHSELFKFATQLRQNGASLREIQQEIDVKFNRIVSTSCVQNWLRDIKLTKEQESAVYYRAVQLRSDKRKDFLRRHAQAVETPTPQKTVPLQHPVEHKAVTANIGDMISITIGNITISIKIGA